MKLAKDWVWDNNAIMYTHPSEVVHQDYPFYWYRVTGLQVQYIKQVNKYCSIILKENEFIKPEPVIDNTSLEDLYIDHRSWLTLGAVVHDPIDQIATFIYGDKKTVMEFTPDGKLYTTKHYKGGKLVYWANFDYGKSKDRYFAKRYQNALGVEAVKTDNGWNWIAGKPLTDKKYGKRK